MEATEVQNNLARLRAKRGLGAAQLATLVGISRQTIYAIEAGTYVPNTAISLKLARTLDATVEDIFQIAEEESAQEEVAEAVLIGDIEAMGPGQPLRLCDVDGQLVAVAAEPGGLGLSPSDAVLLSHLSSQQHTARAKIRLLGDEWKKPNRILISGCDPNVSILAHSLQQQGYEMVVVYENSSRSIESLRCKIVHIAGTHMVDMAGGKADWMPLKKIFGRNSIAVVSYAVWQEGLLTANGNPKGISAITDLVRNDVCIANREPGAGCRRLLDDLLHRFDIAGSQVRGYDHVSVGHLPAARLVRSGEADCCISTQAVARALSLNFIPLVEKPYSLVLHREHLSLPSIQTLIEVLGRASFRREVEACTGYNMRTAGDRLI